MGPVVHELQNFLLILQLFVFSSLHSWGVEGENPSIFNIDQNNVHRCYRVDMSKTITFSVVESQAFNTLHLLTYNHLFVLDWYQMS